MDQNVFNILVISTAVFGGITLASILTLLIIKLSGTCHQCYGSLFSGNEDEDEVLERKGSYTQVSTVNPCDNKHKLHFGSFPPFEIPDKFARSSSPLHPLLALRDESFDSMNSFDTDDGDDLIEEINNKFVAESPLVRSRSLDDIDEAIEVEPELYPGGRRQTIGTGTLGKIRFSLRYLDKGRRKLQLLLHRLDKLLIPSKDVVNVFVSIQLLPDRKDIQRSKGHFSTVCPSYEEAFVFSSSYDDYGFEMKAIQFIVHYMDRSGKEHHYGEAKMPLLSREIYNQVETDVSLNIKPYPGQIEVGDVLLQLSYSFDNDCMRMTVKKVNFIDESTTENYSELHFKCTIKRHRDLIGKKHSTHSVLLQKEPVTKLDISFGDRFVLPKEFFMQSTLKMTITGKNSSQMPGSTTIGKVALGHKSRDECGSIHWRTILMSPELTWSVWHPIYSC